MSTLTRQEIKRRLELSSGDGKLVITPILSEKLQIGDASVDVRLSNQFIAFRMHKCDVFRPYKTPPANLRKMQERQVVRFGERFILHPGMLVLASTLEYISMPSDLECQVEGRSSWARVGLQIATASSIEPGFKGVVTLELSNVGTIPLELYPGVRIAQLFFHDAAPVIEKPYDGVHKYKLSIGPQFSRLFDDKDGKVFCGED